MREYMWRRLQVTFVLGILITLLATSASGDEHNLVPCPSATEKLYTPNRTAIEEKLKKLEGFRADMEGTVKDLDGLSKENAQNQLLGRILGYREAVNQINRAVCASANLTSTVGPANISGIKIYAKVCRATEDAAAAINDLIDCSAGDCLGAGLRIVKGKTKDPDKKHIAGVVRQADKYQEASNNSDTAAKVAAKCAVLPDEAGKALKATKEGCSVITSFAKAAETIQTIQDLDSASQENRARIGKQTDLLNAKIQATSVRIVQLQMDMGSVDFKAMIQQEPNMTPARGKDCEGNRDTAIAQPTHAKIKSSDPASPDEIEKAISQMSAPSLYSPMRSDLKHTYDEQAEPSTHSEGTGAAVLEGVIQALKQMEQAQREPAQQLQRQNIAPQSVSPSQSTSRPLQNWGNVGSGSISPPKPKSSQCDPCFGSCPGKTCQGAR